MYTTTPHLLHTIATQMNTSSSDFSSGCESGWTRYFEKSSSSKSQRTGSMKMVCGEYLEEDRNNCYGRGEEDLSMVSDASSGPRPFSDDKECSNQNECSSYPNNASGSNQKKNKSGKQRDRSQLDDTASSDSKRSKQPSMYYDPSHGQENYAASLSKGRSSRKKYFGS